MGHLERTDRTKTKNHYEPRSCPLSNHANVVPPGRWCTGFPTPVPLSALVAGVARRGKQCPKQSLPGTGRIRNPQLLGDTAPQGHVLWPDSGTGRRGVEAGDVCEPSAQAKWT